MEPCNHRLWPAFAKFAEANGISLVAKADWGPWWECFLAGVKALQEMPHD